MKQSHLIGLATPLLLSAGTLATAESFYQYAFRRINYIPDARRSMQKYAASYYRHVHWVESQANIEAWHMTAPDNQRLEALWLPHPGSKKAVIVGHGYKGTGITMSNFAHMFYDLGFNVLLPDDRGHGESDGQYISFGWLDRLDYLGWLQRIIDRIGADSQLLLFGTSMGGATVSLVAGEPSLPKQVKAVIEDCDYTDVETELAYLLKKQFHLPPMPLVPLASFLNYRRLGYPLRVVNVRQALTRNHLPLLVIHGAEDVYVPTKMGRQNYAASAGPKALWIVPGAAHAESYWINPEAYQAHVKRFLDIFF